MTKEDLQNRIEQVAYEGATDGCNQAVIEREAEKLATEIVKLFAIPVVTHRAWIVEYTIYDSDVLQFNVTDAPNQLAAKAVAMYGLPRKAKLLNCSPVLHGG